MQLVKKNHLCLFIEDTDTFFRTIFIVECILAKRAFLLNTIIICRPALPFSMARMMCEDEIKDSIFFQILIHHPVCGAFNHFE